MTTTFAEAELRLAATLPGYQERPQQQALAKAVEESIADGSTLLSEAGCGAGKSLATLIPAILSKKRTIFSTATKSLQDQVANKDLPFLQENLGEYFSFALLKGRSNYLCLEAARGPEAQRIPGIIDILDRTEDDEFQGERDDLGMEVSNSDWATLTVSSEECPGASMCPWGKECYAERAKERALAADVVVTNHAMLCIEAMLGASGAPGAMLGDFEVLVVDEIHELDGYARNAWTARLTERSFTQICSNIRVWMRQNTDDAEMDGLLGAVSFATKDLWAILAENEGRMRQSDVLRFEDEWVAVIESLQAVLAHFQDWEGKGRDRVEVSRWHRLYRRVENLIARLVDIVLTSDREIVRSVEHETMRRGDGVITVLKSAPVEVGPILNKALWPRATSILVSATVQVDGGFEYPARQLGLTDYRSLDAGTPFDFRTQALLYVPRHLPAPDAATREAWASMALVEMRSLVRESEGRALLLFTSIAQMRTAYRALSHMLPYTCLMQGEEPNKVLARKFSEDVHSVLFATRSFFTGIDIQGESLSLVVIDKLPFAIPTDPLVSAQTELIEARGGNAFSDYIIPEMTLPLVQGFGRLIRTVSDRGVVAILDSRLLTKGYGRRILKSLPPAPLTERFEDVAVFFHPEADLGSHGAIA